MSIIILGCALPALASAAASNTSVALRSHPGDGATLTLAKKIQTALKRGRVTVKTQGAAKHSKAAYSLPDKTGSWNFAAATGSVVLNGRLVLHLGHRTVKLGSLKFTRPRKGNGKVTALVGGKSLQPFVITGHAKVEHPGARETLSGLTASLTKAGATKINRALHANVVHSGESLGALTITVTKSGAGPDPTQLQRVACPGWHDHDPGGRWHRSVVPARGLLGGPEAKVFDLDTSQLEQAAAPDGSLDLKGLLATLSSEGASSLNTALGTNAFTTGTPVGGLTVILPAATPPSS